ncbi:ribonuclease 3-like [Daphnia pulicaria]|uniref:ribonuclease 3-like n=1 Tax=Daphnia pulicaria TaxID=35523 RepID=UPI001EECB3F0|nr:ribonuclease 3-like [Daphnia pulicaria]
MPRWSSLKKILGYEFQNKDNLKLALTHTTSNPIKCPSKDSDRLETLGDKFLVGAMIMVKYYKTYPTYGAEELANLTSMITCNGSCSNPNNHSRRRIAIGIDYPKVYADLFVAVAASIYVDCNEDFNTFRRVFF